MSSHIPLRGVKVTLCFVVACLLACALPAPALAGSDVPRIGPGPIVRSDDGVYKGIPYAAPPVGELRWRPPQPAVAWTEPREFDEFGPQCPQPDADDATSEDCLTVNIWTPDDRDGAKLPVMVFIHGGAFAGGAGSLPLYDGAKLAEAGVVVVTMNYRLGALGFLAHPALSAESGQGVSGNYGLLDQRAALAFVRDNIAAFGGNPKNITVFGQSAGAASILLHLTSPGSQGLFHRAVLQSPVGPGALRPLRTPERGVVPAEEIGRRVAARLGADTAPDVLSALRAASVEDILAASRPGDEAGLEVAGILCSPTVDGVVVPGRPVDMIREGRHARIPLVLGTVANEGSLFLPGLRPAVTSAADYRRLVEKWFGPDAKKVLALRPGTASAWRADLERVVTVRWFEALARFLSREWARSSSPCFLYRLDRPLPESALSILADEAGDEAGAASPTSAGVPHSADIFPVFGYMPWYLGFDGADRDFSKVMRASWTGFAATGQPAGQGRPVWPRFDPGRPARMEFGPAGGASAGMRDVPDDPLCSLVERAWDTTMY
ncbi:carboxylesterase/lipase family protein [Desulfolutivibrio sulfoxidireducens]|uniref:carboxylesterase/lipase family protein n=1 Tax=Desulfolutivibrio sulfoxidireducens TaxID=2773299 RepID=UPI00159D662A|nr:carboxylesterase family protein [Desulfolutivibrio sulfoxidireducens]QLA15509.1 carboxylesterase family protein [Desulfolutivibrio sulfoxidireducens]